MFSACTQIKVVHLVVGGVLVVVVATMMPSRKTHTHMYRFVGRSIDAVDSYETLFPKKNYEIRPKVVEKWSTFMTLLIALIQSR